MYGECITWLTMQERRATGDSSISLQEIYDEKSTLFVKQSMFDSAFHYAMKSGVRRDTAWQERSLQLAFAVRDTAWINATLDLPGLLVDEYDLYNYAIARDLVMNKPPGNARSNDFELQLIVDKNHDFCHKNRGVAFLCSIIPGGGKYYLGYKYQAISAFVICSLLGAAAIESYTCGATSVPFIFTATTFSLFYVGNFWGTMALSKKRVIDHQHQVNEDISGYFRARLLQR